VSRRILKDEGRMMNEETFQMFFTQRGTQEGLRSHRALRPLDNIS
jgi:hypothetical protein